MSKAELSRRTETIDPTALGRMVKGQYPFADHHLAALASALAVKPLQLLPDAPSDRELALLEAVRRNDLEASVQALAVLLNTTVPALIGRTVPNPAPTMPPVQLAGVGQASVALAAQIAQTIADDPAEAAQLVTDWVGATRR